MNDTPILNSSAVALGKKKGVVYDPRTFKLRSFLPRKLPAIPKESYIGRAESIRMYANDRYGCCTVAANAHRIDVMERSALQKEIQLTDTEVLEAYGAITGFQRDKPWTDNGAYMLDVNNYMRKVGLGRERDGSAHTITAFAAVPLIKNLSDEALWQRACWIFGGIYLGAWLPLSAATQLDSGKRWDIVEEDDPDGEPGSWGGHAMTMVGYSEASVVLATWGGRLRATWEWIAKYVDEAYVLISEDWLRSSGKTRAGFNEDALREALAQIDG